MARSYNKLESIEHGASEHASIQHASERSATNIKSDTTTAETLAKCSPEPVENSSLEDHTAYDNEALLLEVHEALNELEQWDSLELKRDHQLIEAQARRRWAKDTDEALLRLQRKRQARLYNPYRRPCAVDRSRLPPAGRTPPPRPPGPLPSQCPDMNPESLR